MTMFEEVNAIIDNMGINEKIHNKLEDCKINY
jgi:hypothetical protein